MIRILFVCLGNICRSPMAEAVLRAKINRLHATDRITVDSAGIGGWEVGSPPHRGTRRVLDALGIPWKGIYARQIEADDFRKFDWLIAMDRENEYDLRHLAQSATDEEKILRFMSLLDDKPGPDVPDPYYRGNFERVYRLIDHGTDALLDRLLKKVPR
ncbi:MAG: low molecular weight phosphotyrosine protein phosphatase [Sporolactobacillus sp.]|nr:low molecular weight phosphotyrosine protein phosphatase [Sporolactobacillus sp.]MCI1881931.1 low molecular weight phosphotyrosine protein phosphatase [Sporolactobacillus sp.]